MDSGTNVITVQRAGSDVINTAATTIRLTLPEEAFTFVSDGVNKWTVTSSNEALSSLDARYPVKTANIQYVNDYIAAGTDTTAVDCSTFIQSAINAAGVGGTIILNGRYRCDTELQLLNYQTVQGTAVFMGTGSPITANCLDFRNITANVSKGNEKVGFRLGQGNIFRNLLISGPGPTVSLSRGISTDGTTTSAPRLYNVQLYSWEHGIHLYGAYYTRMYDCDFQYNGVGIYADACYNLDVYGSKFTCRAADLSSFGTGIYINGLARGLVMHGGSIEDYSVGITVASNSTVTLSGVYFESPNYVGAVGVSAPSLQGECLDLTGCSVYLLNHTYWINIGSATKASLRASGNKFIYNQYDTVAPVDTDTAPTVPIAYNIGLTIGDVHLAGDNWNSVYYHSPNQTSAYTNNAWTTGSNVNYNVQFPLGDASGRDANHYMGRHLILPAGKNVSSAGLKVFEGSNAKQGTATLVAGTATVANTSVTATSRIFLTVQSLGTVTSPKALGVTARSAGTSFTITSADNTDTSVIAYEIFEVG